MEEVRTVVVLRPGGRVLGGVGCGDGGEEEEERCNCGAVDLCIMVLIQSDWT